jgi:hypothetical protein
MTCVQYTVLCVCVCVCVCDGAILCNLMSWTRASYRVGVLIDWSGVNIKFPDAFNCRFPFIKLNRNILRAAGLAGCETLTVFFELVIKAVWGRVDFEASICAACFVHFILRQ